MSDQRTEKPDGLKTTEEQRKLWRGVSASRDNRKSCLTNRGLANLLDDLATLRQRVERLTWTQTPPTEQGEYWHWDGNPDIAPFALSVMWSGTAQKCFVCIKDVPGAPFCDEWGGWWQRIPQPPQPDIRATEGQEEGK